MIELKPLTTDEQKRWIFEQANVYWHDGMRGIVAEEDDTILAAAVFEGWTEVACTVHFAIHNPRVYQTGFLNAIWTYLFVTTKRKFVFGQIASDNASALAFAKDVGMKEVARLDGAVSQGVDMVIVKLERPDEYNH